MDARYSRQLALPGFGLEAQQAMLAAKVLVVGAGGLGSTVIPALAGAGVGTIGIVDDDVVELSNLHRQLMHGVADIGRRKVDSATATVAALNPETTIVAVDARLTRSSALEVASDFDIIIDGSDNFPTRYLCNDVAELLGVPLVWGAVSQYDGQVGVAWAARGPTYRDLFPTPPPAGSVLSCELGGVLPTVVATVGSMMATEAIKIITGLGDPLIGRVLTVDALRGTIRSLDYARDPHATPVTELIDYELFCGVAQESRSIEGAAAGLKSSDRNRRELGAVDLGALDRSAVERGAIDLSALELAARLDGVTLIDVREPWEAELASIPGSILVPLGVLSFDPVGAMAGIDQSKPIVVYCHHGIRSANGRELLESHGIAASHLAGGIDAWAREIDREMIRY